jgi:hypothetical protein
MVRMLLESLGSTPDEVAVNLKANGIQGVRNTLRFLNPIVRYLRTQLPADVTVDVRQRTNIRLAFWDGTEKTAAIPEAARQFMEAFDAGDYPELELSES